MRQHTLKNEIELDVIWHLLKPSGKLNCHVCVQLCGLHSFF